MIVLGLRKNRCPEVPQVMLHHLHYKLVLTGMTTWMTSCPPNHGLQHMMFLSLYMNLESERRQKGKARGSSSHVAPPAAQTCVNWDDDMDDFMPPPNHGLQHMMFLPLYMNVDPEKR